MDAVGVEQETSPLDRFHVKNNSYTIIIRTDASDDGCIVVFLSAPIQMASMASFDFTRPSSVDSDRPMSHSSSRSASSLSLVSSVVSSDLEDYFSCTDDMATELDESSEELNFPSDDEAEEQPSTVLIYSGSASPDASSKSPLCPPSSDSLIQPLTTDRATQSDERDVH